MNTQELIESIARGAGPAPHFPVARKLGRATSVALLASVALCVAAFDPIPREMLATPAPWIKLAYAGGLSAGALWLVGRLSRPLALLAPPLLAVALVFAAMGLTGVAAWTSTPVTHRLAMLIGSSGVSCPTRIFALSVPVLLWLLWTMRDLAPTRLRAAGLAAGLLAGGIASFAYASVCHEQSAAFVAVWYSLGIALAACLGALLGPRALRW